MLKPQNALVYAFAGMDCTLKAYLTHKQHQVFKYVMLFAICTQPWHEFSQRAQLVNNAHITMGAVEYGTGTHNAVQYNSHKNRSCKSTLKTGP